jgi:hypothetical protein
MKLRIATKQFRLAGATAIYTSCFSIGVLPHKRRFGCGLSQNGKGHWINLAAKFGFIDFDWVWNSVRSQFSDSHAETSLGKVTPVDE